MFYMVYLCSYISAIWLVIKPNLIIKKSLARLNTHTKVLYVYAIDMVYKIYKNVYT